MTEKQRQRLQRGKDTLYSKPLFSSSPVYRFFQRLFFICVIAPAFFLIFKPILGVKVKNREIVKRLKKSGYVLICNHVFVLDSIINNLATLPRQMIYTSQEETMYISFMRILLRFIKTVPILKTDEGIQSFMEQMTAELKRGSACVIYPEGEIVTLCDHLRPFKNGAFRLAHRADVPIVPMVITPREADGLRKLFRRNFSFNIEIAEPIIPNSAEFERTDALRMKKEAIEKMNHLLDTGGHAYPEGGINDKNAFWQVKKSKEI